MPMSSFSLDPKLGVIELGVLVSSVFYGLPCVQALAHAQKAERDRYVLKLIVASTL